MVDSDERLRLINEVFAATGRKLTEDDPLTVAALFYAVTVRAAGKEAARDVTAAAAPLIEAAEAAAKDRAALADAFSARLDKHVRQAVKAQADQGDKLIPQWHATVAFVAGAIGVLLATIVACDFSVSWPNQAAVGRDFLRALPSMEPELRAKLLDHVEHTRKHP
jgi:hypothetical protein